jgi:hypothetical protein
MLLGITEVSLKLCIVHSYNHTQQCVHKGFLQEFVVFVANGIKILAQDGLDNDCLRSEKAKPRLPGQGI